MRRNINDEIEEFSKLLSSLESIYQVVEFCPHTFIVTPRQNLGKTEKKIDLCLLGLVHGNELASVAIINEFLRFLLTSRYQLGIRLGLALGNVPAALEGKRFLDKDLNRSFLSQASGLREVERAKELEPFLQEVNYLVDFHQTIMPNQEPFFIFPYKSKSLKFARGISPLQAVVTHWGGSFSKEGLCSDEFVNRFGGTGITVETGEQGFDPYQIGYGFYLALNALKIVDQDMASESCRSNKKNNLPLYTWAHIENFPLEGRVELIPGLNNFKKIYKGEVLGSHNGKKILAFESGKILFPKYFDFSSGLSRPTELFRIIREINEDELPD